MLTLGSALKRLRQAAGLTQRELSERLDVDSTYLSHLEADRKEPSMTLLKSMAAVLEIPPGLLLATAMWVDLPPDQRARFEPMMAKLLEMASGEDEIPNLE
jgi:transcriptional regulator with XRE-family HTH domain